MADPLIKFDRSEWKIEPGPSEYDLGIDNPNEYKIVPDTTFLDRLRAQATDDSQKFEIPHRPYHDPDFDPYRPNHTPFERLIEDSNIYKLKDHFEMLYKQDDRYDAFRPIESRCSGASCDLEGGIFLCGC